MRAISASSSFVYAEHDAATGEKLTVASWNHHFGVPAAIDRKCPAHAPIVASAVVASFYTGAGLKEPRCVSVREAWFLGLGDRSEVGPAGDGRLSDEEVEWDMNKRDAAIEHLDGTLRV